MPEGTIHLSANMCGEERSDVIATVKSLLLEGNVVRVVSTQLVEAGVDLDFPVVFRALAGVDSIAQAAGRCNRGASSMRKTKLVKLSYFRPHRNHLRVCCARAKAYLVEFCVSRSA